MPWWKVTPIIVILSGPHHLETVGKRCLGTVPQSGEEQGLWEPEVMVVLPLGWELYALSILPVASWVGRRLYTGIAFGLEASLPGLGRCKEGKTKT